MTVTTPPPLGRADGPLGMKVAAHPLRIRILRLLEPGGTMTPKKIAAELGLRLENVSYHVRILRDFKFIKLHRKGQVRGAVEHYYGIDTPGRILLTSYDLLGSGGLGRAAPELTEEFMVCHALGYPDPWRPVEHTLDEARRFQGEHGGEIRRRYVTDWEVVE